MEERVEQFRDKLAEWRNTVLFKNLPNETRESAFTDVRTILYSDLFEFPYTINTALIKQFKDENIQPPQ